MANLTQAAAGISQLEILALGHSPVHRLHPMAKLLTTVLYIIAVVSFPPQNVSGLVAFGIYPAVMMPLSGTPYRPLCKRLLAALPFPLLGGLSNLFLSKGAVFYLGPLLITAGMIAFLSILLKTLLSVFAVLILISTTPFADVARQLSILRVPKALCLQLVMTYRYLSVLLTEAGGMYTAYTLRAPQAKGIHIRDMGSFLGQLILRSFDRAERVYRAMVCRGFTGIYHSGTQRRLRPADGIFLIISAGSIVFFRFINISLLLGRLYIQ